jgi:Fe2+ transport system protein FeoA
MKGKPVTIRTKGIGPGTQIQVDKSLDMGGQPVVVRTRG